MRDKVAKLIELKSIVTLLLILTVVFVVVYLTLSGAFAVSQDFFVGVVMAVITYYFTRGSTATKSETLDNNIAEASKPPGDETTPGA